MSPTARQNIRLDDLDGLWDGLRDLQDYIHGNARNKGFHAGADRLREARAAVEALPVTDVVKDLLRQTLDDAERDKVGNRLMLCVGELIEAHEEIRHGRAPGETYYIGKTTGKEYDTQSPLALEKPEGVPSEIADTVIRCFDFAGEHGIDLAGIIREKMAYNETRDAMHGGKRF